MNYQLSWGTPPHLLDQFECYSAGVWHLAALLQHRGEADQLTPVAAGLLLAEGDGTAVRVGAALGHAVQHPHLLREPAQHSALQYLHSIGTHPFTSDSKCLGSSSM